MHGLPKDLGITKAAGIYQRPEADRRLWRQLSVSDVFAVRGNPEDADGVVDPATPVLVMLIGKWVIQFIV